jgi:hypothetical protein
MKPDLNFVNSESFMKNEYMYKNTPLQNLFYVLIGKVLVDKLTKIQA